MKPQLIFHHCCGFTWVGRAIFKNRRNLMAQSTSPSEGVFDLRSFKADAQATTSNLELRGKSCPRSLRLLEIRKPLTIKPG